MEAANRVVPTSGLGAVEVAVQGVVQGVGFRPFVYRLARRLGLSGWVSNDTQGVCIHAEGPLRQLARFEELLAEQAPPAAAVTGVASVPARPAGHASFRILPSRRDEGARPGDACLVRVPPDRAACPECRRETANPADRRHGYPFTTCTDCGPRYSILRRMPYDRPDTTMAGFPLCPACRAEYEGPDHRRFHAQPIACPDCGPRVALWGPTGREMGTGPDAVRRAAGLLREGRVLALKGLGGFQLLVRADSSEAVARLRQRKGRPTKPLAVMVPTLAAAARLAEVGPTERGLLTSPENPIVLLRRRSGAEASLVREVAPRLEEVGLLLPTTPLHHLLLAEVDFAVVTTSGNRSEEPILTDERELPGPLAEVADAFLVHDRPIARRVDDSVVRAASAGPVVLRLARGYAPLPLLALERWMGRHAASPGTPRAVLAVGAHQKAAVALWTGTQAVLSPHAGDLDSPQTRAAFEGLAQGLADLYGCVVGAVACDLHPDYFSTRWAGRLGLPLVPVQHHHAHAVACLVEHDLLDEEVLAFAWDGTGYGPDGTVWGGEALLARLTEYERVASLRPFPLPGNEAAVREPARVALALLAEALGTEAVLNDAGLLARLGLSAAKARTLLRLVERGVNAPWTSSVGRLFDAVAALLLPVGKVSYEGEAATRLESLAAGGAVGGYPLPLTAPALPSSVSGAGQERPHGDWGPLLRALLADLRCGVSVDVIAARFHQALADWAAAVASLRPGPAVVLGGGCFQNALLLERTRAALAEGGRRVYHAGRIPPGDGGLAAGQLAVALGRLLEGQCGEASIQQRAPLEYSGR